MKKMRTIFLFLFGCCCLCSQAQVSIGNRTLGGNNLKIDLVMENDSIFLLLSYTDTKNKIEDAPKLLVRLIDDTVISLDATTLESFVQTDEAAVGENVLFSRNYFVSEARFPITKDQIEIFSRGIKKLRLNTSPKIYERTWTDDKVGRKLYNKYVETRSKPFEEGF